MKKEVKKLIRELFDGKFSRNLTRKDLARILSQPNVYYFFHLGKGRIVAMSVLYTVELFSRKFGVIEEVVTLKKYRNQGIGSGLVKKAIEKGRSLGLTCIELTVRDDKLEVKKFYEKLGFYDRNNTAMRLWINKG